MSVNVAESDDYIVLKKARVQLTEAYNLEVDAINKRIEAEDRVNELKCAELAARRFMYQAASCLARSICCVVNNAQPLKPFVVDYVYSQPDEKLLETFNEHLKGTVFKVKHADEVVDAWKLLVTLDKSLIKAGDVELTSWFFILSVDEFVAKYKPASH
jgi:hypothetical protein